MVRLQDNCFTIGSRFASSFRRCSVRLCPRTTTGRAVAVPMLVSEVLAVFVGPARGAGWATGAARVQAERRHVRILRLAPRGAATKNSVLHAARITLVASSIMTAEESVHICRRCVPEMKLPYVGIAALAPSGTFNSATIIVITAIFGTRACPRVRTNHIARAPCATCNLLPYPIFMFP